MIVLSWRLHLFQLQNEGLSILEILRDLESQCLSEISAMLNGEISGQDLGELFFDCVDAEIKFYQWGGKMIVEISVLSYHRFQSTPFPPSFPAHSSELLLFLITLSCVIHTVIITSTVSVTAPPGGQTLALFQQKALDKTVSHLRPSPL